MHPEHPCSIDTHKRTESLRDRVLEHIRTAITTGEIRDGIVLTAPALSLELGVSTTPVREAMMDLVSDGLVTVIKNKGFRVTSMDAEALDHISQLRLMVEPAALHAIDLSEFLANRDQLLKLADACTEAAANLTLDAYLRNDRLFHELLLSGTKNPEIVRLATSLRVRTRMYGLTALAKTGQLARSSREHHELVALIEAGNLTGAEQLMRQHIGHARGMWATGITE